MITSKKKMKTRSTKIEKPFVEYKTVTEIDIEKTGIQFLPVSTEVTLEFERNKIKKWQSLKVHQYFLKTKILKVITDIR